VVVSHPIQYWAPLLRLLAESEGIRLKCVFLTNFTVQGQFDPGFGVQVKWDVPLLEGYEHEFIGGRQVAECGKLDRQRVSDLNRIVSREYTDVLLLHGFHTPTAVLAIAMARARGIPVMLRTDTQRGVVKRAKGLRGTVKELLVRRVVRAGDAMLSVGTLNAKYYSSLGVPDSKIFRVPYAVENGRFALSDSESKAACEELQASLSLDAGHPVILFAGKFQKRKRASDLYAAFKLLKQNHPSINPYLLYVGDGEGRSELEAAVRADGTNRVVFAGFQNQTALPKFLKLSSVFVLPSDAEPWGLAVNEAMSASKAVIVSDEVGCAPDLVQNNVNGTVFPVGDIDALAESLATVLANESTWTRMGQSSAEIISDWTYDADIVGIRAAIAAVSRPGTRP
jgi:glycosyltransferase involved in cell wall biosynthesis